MKKLQTILSILLMLTLLAGCAVSAATLPREEAAVPEKLTAEEAQAIALADAGLTAEAVRGLRTEFEIDDAVPEYEVDFRSGDTEYDYTIHAETGAVLRRGKEYDPPEAPRPAPLPQATEPAASGEITAEEAEDIALDHAGFARTDVTALRTERDVDDGAAEYEVEFYHGGLEYSYEIHAETGTILDVDRDD